MTAIERMQHWVEHGVQDPGAQTVECHPLYTDLTRVIDMAKKWERVAARADEDEIVNVCEYILLEQRHDRYKAALEEILHANENVVSDSGDVAVTRWGYEEIAREALEDDDAVL